MLAPAQEVVITDQLDIAKIDLSTFSLGPILFGDKQVVPPTGLSEFTTDIDLRPDNNLIVRVDARLDTDTGDLTWRLTSIDPATGGLPDDPLEGFLPPNINPPEGDGSVLFTVMPKASLSTGTVIRNQAEIIFDVNEPIVTPEWFNTLDNTKPTSKVQPLDSIQNSTDFTVEWSGTDNGSGVKDYTIFVSEDNGPFTVWLSNTPDTSGTLSGESGKTYAFYSVAQDQTGNLEDAPSEADTSTTVQANLPPVAQCTDVMIPTDATVCNASPNLDDLAAQVGAGSSDPNGDSISLSLSPTGPYNLGTTNITLMVTDDKDASDSCDAMIIVVDQEPPSLSCPDSVMAECTGSDGATVPFNAIGADNCSSSLSVSCDPASDSTFPLESTSVSCNATDESGNSSSCDFAVTVQDTTAPIISLVSADPNELFPPNHKMKPVTVSADVSDVCDAAPACRIIEVSSNEPVDGLGDGDTAPDWEITGDLTVNLRAERSGEGNGRVYTITVECTDTSGNVSTGTTTVTVPHDRS